MRVLNSVSALRLGAAALALGLSLPSLAGNVEAGRAKAEAAGCFACHGVDGVKVSDPSFPMLAGQYPDFLERALSDYKRGARKNAIMTGMAANLSKQEIQDLAAYFAAQPGPLGLIKR